MSNYYFVENIIVKPIMQRKIDIPLKKRISETVNLNLISFKNYNTENICDKAMLRSFLVNIYQLPIFRKRFTSKTNREKPDKQIQNYN